MFVLLVELDFPSPEFLLEFTLTLQVKKLEKKVRKLQQLLRAKAEQNTRRRRRKRNMENIWRRLKTFSSQFGSKQEYFCKYFIF